MSDNILAKEVIELSASGLEQVKADLGEVRGGLIALDSLAGTAVKALEGLKGGLVSVRDTAAAAVEKLAGIVPGGKNAVAAVQGLGTAFLNASAAAVKMGEAVGGTVNSLVGGPLARLGQSVAGAVASAAGRASAAFTASRPAQAVAGLAGVAGRGLARIGTTVARSRVGRAVAGVGGAVGGKAVAAVAGALPAVGSALASLGKSAVQLTGALGQAAEGLAKFGGIVLTAGTAAAAIFNPVAFEQLGYVLRDLTAVVGEAFSPVLEALIPIVRSLGDAFLNSGLVEAIQGLVVQLTPVFTRVAELVGSLMPAFVPLVDAFGQLAQAVMPLVDALIPALQELVPAVVDVGVQLVQALAPLVRQLAEGLVPVIQALVPVIGDMLEALSPVIGILADVLTPVVGIVADVLQALVPVIELVGVVFQALAPLIELLGNVIRPIAELLGGVLRPVIQTLADAISSAVHGIVDLMNGFIRWYNQQAWLPGYINEIRLDRDRHRHQVTPAHTGLSAFGAGGGGQASFGSVQSPWQNAVTAGLRDPAARTAENTTQMVQILRTAAQRGWGEAQQASGPLVVPEMLRRFLGSILGGAQAPGGEGAGGGADW